MYSINRDTGEIEPGKVENAAITRENEKLIRVWIDDESYFDTTLDHKFIMRDGTEKRADELNENDSLAPLYRDYKPIDSRKNSTYEMLYDLKSEKWK